MRKILVLTVGGSCAPIVKSVRQHGADYVHFVCNADHPQSGRKGSRVVIDGPGMVCGEDRSDLDLPNILTQTSLRGGEYDIHEVEDPDDLDECYAVASRVLAEARAEYPNAKLLADYTGATKSMSSALVVAALTHGAELQVVRGDRRDLGKATPDTNYTSRSIITGAFLDRQLEVVSSLERNGDYLSAARVIEELMREQGPQGDAHRALQARLSLCRAFDRWDSFDHLDAYDRLSGIPSKGLRRHARPFIDVLHAILQSRAELDDGLRTTRPELLARPFPGSDGFEIVRDLLANAERRARQGRYDDAVGRLYRATELVAQFVLRRDYGVVTSNVDAAILPEEVRSWFAGGGRVQLDMVKAHDLLARLHEAYGGLWGGQRQSIIGALQVRNHSVLAHGFEPIGESEYYRIKDQLASHVERSLECFGGNASPLPQLPDDLGLLIRESSVA